MNIGSYRPYLSDIIFQHLRNCHLALAEKQYFASAVWGAVFLEAFLGTLNRGLGIRAQSQDDLNGRIQQLRQYSKNHPQDAPSVPGEIIKRCDDIRNIRNRLVHDMGLPKNTLLQDAESIYASLGVILDWYLTLGLLTRAQNTLASQLHIEQVLVPVFISTITPHIPLHAYFIDTLLERLMAIGIEPIRFKPDQFDKRDPTGQVRQAIEKCKGLIVIGLERSHAYFVRDKEGSDKEEEETHRKYTSGWLHLEAGMASALGLDVFVICQRNLLSDGIFDREWNSYRVVELTSLDEDSPQLKDFLELLAKWVRTRQHV